MTPEEIIRRNAAKNAGGELGETVARARPSTIYVDQRGNAAGGPQAERAVQAGRSFTAQQGVESKMATDRAGRLNAMNKGGVAGLEQELAKQTARPVAGGAAPATTKPSGSYQAGRALGQQAASIRDTMKASSKLGATGRALGAAGGGLVAAQGIADIAENGATVTNTADTASGLVGTAASLGARVNPFAGAAATGWGVGRMIDSLIPQDIRDTIGGTINQGLRNIGDWDGVKMGVNDDALLAQEAAAGPKPTMRERFNSALGIVPDAPKPAQTGDTASGAGTSPQPGAATEPKADAVLGTINGREIRQSEASALAGSQQGLSSSAGNLFRLPQDDGQGNLLGMLEQARSDRLGVQGKANERLSGLYKQFNDLMGKGKRRSAAVVGDLISKELGVVSGTASGQMIDPRRNVASPEESARTQAIAEGAQIDNRAKAQAQQFLQEYLANPESEAGKKALAKYQATTGGGEQGEPYTFITQQALDGPPQVLRGNKRTGSLENATPKDAAAGVPAGYKMVGTSGGVPVYEDANGNRVTF